MAPVPTCSRGVTLISPLSHNYSVLSKGMEESALKGSQEGVRGADSSHLPRAQTAVKSLKFRKGFQGSAPSKGASPAIPGQRQSLQCSWRGVTARQTSPSQECARESSLCHVTTGVMSLCWHQFPVWDRLSWLGQHKQPVCILLPPLLPFSLFFFSSWKRRGSQEIISTGITFITSFHPMFGHFQATDLILQKFHSCWNIQIVGSGETSPACHHFQHCVGVIGYCSLN